MSDEQTLSDKVRYFISDHSSKRISKNLRIVWFDYLRYQTAGLHVEFDEILADIEALFDLLEVLSEESRPG